MRFVCFRTVEGERTRLGLFQAMKFARESEQGVGWALDLMHEASAWFDDNLKAPDTFERGDYWRGRLGQAGLSWFKPEAVEHIQEMHAIKTGMEACGLHVDVLTTRDPGYIIWEDEHQIVAEPGDRRF